jgi:hypothetical protein
MIGVVLALWFYIGIVVGRLSCATAQPITNSPIIDPELFAKAVDHAKTMAVTIDPQFKQHQKQHQQLLEELRNGSVEALYTVAQSLNKRNVGEDRITSVQLWHHLADEADHVPSAVALGFSYAEVDKELALKYFVQASNGDDEGPHQASLYNAGRLLLELNEAAMSLAYIRSCANVEKKYPAYATPAQTKTCKEAYELLSNQIMTKTTPGIEDATEMFLYASIDDYPQANTNEFTKWTKAMEFLEMYASLMREEDGASGDANKKAKAFVTYLLSAQEQLLSLQKSSKKLSELQNYLIEIILGRIQVLVTASTEETGQGEL